MATLKTYKDLEIQNDKEYRHWRTKPRLDKQKSLCFSIAVCSEKHKGVPTHRHATGFSPREFVKRNVY